MTNKNLIIHGEFKKVQGYDFYDLIKIIQDVGREYEIVQEPSVSNEYLTDALLNVSGSKDVFPPSVSDLTKSQAGKRKPYFAFYELIEQENCAFDFAKKGSMYVARTRLEFAVY